MLKNSVKISNYLSNLWMNISGIKRIVYKAKKFGIRSLFVSIWFEIDRIVHAWLNIAVTYIMQHDYYNNAGFPEYVIILHNNCIGNFSLTSINLLTEFNIIEVGNFDIDFLFFCHQFQIVRIKFMKFKIDQNATENFWIYINKRKNLQNLTKLF